MHKLFAENLGIHQHVSKLYINFIVCVYNAHMLVVWKQPVVEDIVCKYSNKFETELYALLAKSANCLYTIFLFCATQSKNCMEHIEVYNEQDKSGHIKMSSSWLTFFVPMHTHILDSVIHIH